MKNISIRVKRDRIKKMKAESPCLNEQRAQKSTYRIHMLRPIRSVRSILRTCTSGIATVSPHISFLKQRSTVRFSSQLTEIIEIILCNNPFYQILKCSLVNEKILSEGSPRLHEQAPTTRPDTILESLTQRRTPVKLYRSMKQRKSTV